MRNPAFDIAIVICTFHREALLAKALDSVNAQRRPAGLRVCVVVSDNSDGETARDVVAAKAAASPFPMRWIAAHPANISVARNSGVAAADARYIAFIDDDQELEPGWLEAVADAIARLPHDIFFGAVEASFEAPALATPLTRQLFSRRLDAPSGAEMFAMGPNKTQGVALATNNAVFRHAAMPDPAAPFDAAFGHGGGEDYDLVCRMQNNGCRFAWLPQARASEFVPAARCEPAYLRRRFYTGAQIFALVVANARTRPRLARWLLRGKAAAQAMLLAAALPAHALRGRIALRDYSYVWAGVLGKMSFGGVHPIYRTMTPDGRPASPTR